MMLPATKDLYLRLTTLMAVADNTPDPIERIRALRLAAGAAEDLARSLRWDRAAAEQEVAA